MVFDINMNKTYRINLILSVVIFILICFIYYTLELESSSDTFPAFDNESNQISNDLSDHHNHDGVMSADFMLERNFSDTLTSMDYGSIEKKLGSSQDRGFGKWTQTAIPKNLLVVVPFNKRNFGMVTRSLLNWKSFGDICPIVRSLDHKPVDLVLYYATTFEMESFSKDYRKSVTDILDSNGMTGCFNSVKFLSAKLIDVATNVETSQFYQLYMNGVSGISTRSYNFMMWLEPEVAPIRGGFIDKLVSEVTFSGNFIMRGGVRRSEHSMFLGKRDTHSIETTSLNFFTQPITSASLYKMNDPTFYRLCREVCCVVNLQS